MGSSALYTSAAPALPPSLRHLDTGAAAKALAAASDLVLVIDADGVVSDVAAANDDLAAATDWRGQHWADTVEDDSRAKVGELIAAAADDETPRWRQVNQSMAGVSVPIRFVATPTPEGGVIAIGRDMRSAAAMQQRLLGAQQAMERDSMRLRQVEARYRLLFDVSGDAVVIVDTATRRIVEANPAARRLAGLNGGGLDGQPLTVIVHDDDREAALGLIGAVAAAEQRHPARIRLANDVSVLMAATLFRQDRATYLLLRLTPLEGAAPAIGGALGDVLERIPDPFVLTDARLEILTKNNAFLDLIHEPRRDAARGEPLGKYLGRPGIDLGLLAAQLAEHGSVRNFTTIVRDIRGGEEEVEVSAVAAPDGGETRYGFSIRPVLRRRLDPGGEATLPRSVEQLTELVGRVSLKEIVRESTDLIERLCIEAALAYTSDNRASAAEILGLSRQSLYSKLHRHGLGNLMGDGD